MENSESIKVYQIKITLKDVHPPVWRRILVSDKITLFDLHYVIQDVFSWLDYHLHEFTINGKIYGDPQNDEFGDLFLQDETKYKLRKLNLKEGSHFTYEYDFGDGWEHTLLVEKILPFERGTKLPQCIKGKRACPPEDVGGPWGYSEFLEAIDDPKNEEHDSLLEWVGGEFYPEEFDLEAVNERLRQFSEKKWPKNDPTVINSNEEIQGISFDPKSWIKFLSIENDETARSLDLQKDVITFLTYLQKNKVTGTQSTGNLPRKVIEELASLFVKPPVLERKFGETVYRFRSEDEVWPILFVHMLAKGSNLIRGGAGRRWVVTSNGEDFLKIPAIAQVWVLLAGWWYKIDWQIAYDYDIFGGEMPNIFRTKVASQLLTLSPDEPQSFDIFIDQLIQKMNWAWSQQDSKNYRLTFESGIRYMVIDPLEDFGILSTQRIEENESYPDIKLVSSFSLTRFGQDLLESIKTFLEK